MKCVRVQERILLHLAGELEPQEAAAVRQHLLACPRCAALARELEESQDLLEQSLRTTVSAPRQLDARVMQTVRALPARRRQWPAFSPPWNWHSRLVPATMACGLLLGGFLLGRGLRPGAPGVGTPVVELQRVAQASAAFETAPTPVQIEGPSAAQVQTRLAALVKFPVAAPDLKNEGARLLGGREERMNGVPVAWLFYAVDGQRVTVYQTDCSRLTLQSLHPLHGVGYGPDCAVIGKSDGLTYIAWCTGHSDCVLLSKLPADRLLRLAQSLSHAAVA